MPVDAPVQFISPREPKPEWLKVRAPGSQNFVRLKGIMQELKLNTVCEDAHCPNIGECWHHGTATFMILGDVCTRACAYCAVAHGRPNELDTAEPARVAEAGPWWDAAIAMTSIAAQILLSLRKRENWMLWIVANLVSIGVYAVKGLWPTTGLYVILLGLAIWGLVSWTRAERTARA